MSAIFGGRGDTRPLFFHLNWNQRFTAWIIVALVFLGIVSYAFEFRKLENTFQVSKLITWSFITILPFLAAIAWNMSKSEKGMVDKIRGFLIIFIGAGIFIPLIGGLSNRLLSWHKWETVTYEVFELDEHRENYYGRTYYDYDVFVVYKNNLEKIQLLGLDAQIKKGDQITLKQKKGFWGYPLIDPYSYQSN